MNEIAIASVPVQEWEAPYPSPQALQKGSIFPQLHMPFFVEEQMMQEAITQAAAGLPFSAIEFQSKGDALTDLHEDLAAEQKARTVYDNLLRMIDDPDVREPLKFLRAREVVHFQRFGEALERTKARLDSRNYYYFNPEFDKMFLHNQKSLS